MRTRSLHLLALLTASALMLSLQPATAERAPQLRRVLPRRPLCCSNGIALEGNRLYVNHAALDRMSVIDVNNRAIELLASERDAEDEELVTPDDLWVDPVTKDVYVTEILSNGVRRITPDGDRQRIMSGFGDGTAHPNAITGLRRAGEELRLFVSMVSFEPNSKTGIWEIDPERRFPPRLVYGAAGGQVVYGHGMRAPNAMQFDPEGRELFVPETYGGAVWAIDVDAHSGRLVYGGSSPSANSTALRFAADGSILYVEQSSGRVLRLDPGGPADQTPEVVAQLDPGIDGIAEHDDGRLFLSNFRFGGVAVVHPDGRVEQMFRRSLNLPNGVAEIPGGDIAVGDLGSLAIVDPTRPLRERLTRPKQFIRDDFDITVGVAALGRCDVYATGFFRGTLQYVDVCHPNRAHREVVPRKTFVAPWDIATGDSELWVSDASGSVWHIRDVDKGGPARPRPIATGLANPTGIARGKNGLYVSESGANQVRVLHPATGATIDIIRNLDEPEGVALRRGAVIVVEAGARRLTLIRPNGSRRVLARSLATRIRGVSVIPVLNFFSDVTVVGRRAVLVTSPKDGSLLRVSL